MGKFTLLALALLTLGIIYVMVSRPSVNPTTAPASTTNSLLNLLSAGTNLASKLVGSKPAAPTALVDVGGDAGTYNKDTSDLSVQGNKLVNTDTDTAVTYGTD
jgi:hypothetical protein